MRFYLSLFQTDGLLFQMPTLNLNVYECSKRDVVFMFRIQCAESPKWFPSINKCAKHLGVCVCVRNIQMTKFEEIARMPSWLVWIAPFFCVHLLFVRYDE